MSPDGKSFITSVGSQDGTVWLHDKNGDQQISSEGTADAPSFSSDGNRLYFLMANGQTGAVELWVKELAGGKIEKVLPGYPMGSYSISRDGTQVAFAMNDQSGHSSLWIAPTDRSSSPLRISSTTNEDSPHFLPDGEIVFRAVEGPSNFLYRMKADGTGRRKITSQPILEVLAISPDGRWVFLDATSSHQGIAAVAKLLAVEGEQEIRLCTSYCLFSWDKTGKFAYLYIPELFEGSYALPIERELGLPKLPPNGITRKEEVTGLKNAVAISGFVASAMSPTVYAYTRQNTRRNLYRIPLP